MAQVPTPAWIPDREVIDRSNVRRLMATVGVDTYEDLHAWSVSNTDAFWQTVIDELDIRFDRDPRSIRGSSDPRHPDWLPDATLNIASSCLDGPHDAPAIVHARGGHIETITVGQLREQVAAFAGGFSRAKFSIGDRIAIVMPMTVEAVVAYLGTISAGGVVVSIADSFAPDEIAVRLDLTDPVGIITQDRSMRLGRSLPMYAKCVEASDLPCVVVDTGAELPLRANDVAWDEFVATGTAFDPVVSEAGTHTNILFSSGTTGEPKVIPWTQTTPIKAAMDGRFHLDIGSTDVVAWPTNLGWMMGPWLIYASLLNGAAMALFDDAPTNRAFVDFVEEAGVSVLGLVPSIVAAWRGAGTLRGGDWSSVRVLASTGEASNPGDYRWLMEAAGGVPVVEYCGGTEVGGGYLTGTIVQPAVPSRFTTSALGTGVVIVGEDGHASDVGEVYLVPPSMGMSTELIGRDHDDVYYSDLPAGFGPLRRHGDQIAREEGGMFRVLGRVDDTMNLGGIKVSSAELEDVVGAADGVVECAAIAVSPAEGGPDRLVVFVVVSGGSSVDGDALKADMQDRIRSHLNPLFRIHEVVVVDALPRTASHKVMRRTLRKDFTV